MSYGTCWLCGKNGAGDPLDKHHIFGGAYRKKSEKLGLVVSLCHDECHIFGRNAAHRNRETMQKLHEYGQREAMDRFGWTVDEFRLEFGKNYLDGDGCCGDSSAEVNCRKAAREAGLRHCTGEPLDARCASLQGEEIIEVVGFCILEDVELPY